MKKRVVIQLSIIVIIILSLLSIYFVKVKVNIILSSMDRIYLEASFKNRLFSPYYYKITTYPETNNYKYHLYSPTAALLAVKDGNVLDNSICYNIDEKDQFTLSFTKNNSRFLEALKVNSSFNIALLYDSTSSEENEIADILKDYVVLIDYENKLSDVASEVIKERLNHEKIGLLIIPNLANCLKLTYLIDDISICTTTYYQDVLENRAVEYIISEDFEKMIAMLKDNQKGVLDSPYKLSSRSKSIKVFFNNLF